MPLAATEQQWPPQSPGQAMLLTPSGRDKYRRMLERGESPPSPSPSRSRTARLVPTASPRAKSTVSGRGIDETFEDVDEDDDEETLQLKLQQIQAQLRLKKLQKEKGAHAGHDAPESSSQASIDATKRLKQAFAPRPGLAARPTSPPLRGGRLGENGLSKPIEIPASPVRKVLPQPNMTTSPSRILLGIDKGLRGKDVSLKRAPSLRKAGPEITRAPGNDGGGFLRHAKTEITESQPRQLTFSEKLASARNEEIDRTERRQKVQQRRSNNFEIGRDEMANFKKTAVDIPVSREDTENFSRDQVMASIEQPGGVNMPRSSTMPHLGAPQRAAATDDVFARPGTATTTAPVTSYEPYSGYHLSKRILPHSTLTRAISGKKTYGVSDLLRAVRSPDYALPDDVDDIVFFAIVATKSDPKHHKPRIDPKTGKELEGSANRSKYMAITLVDLTLELDLFLFDTGFERFWKLDVGTIIAILNPVILAPNPGQRAAAAAGRFNIVVNSDADTVLEIGTARDLGFCQSRLANGKLCSGWINSRRSEFCEFHTNAAIDRARVRRVELNTSSGLGGDHRPKSRLIRENKWAKKVAATEKHHGKLDGDSGLRYFVSGGKGRSVASLIDDREESAADTKERAETLRRKLAAKERERSIANTLGMKGGGAGRDYLKAAGGPAPGSMSLSASVSAVAFTSQQQQQLSQPPRVVDAASLGLLAPKGTGAAQVHLSPIKRKCPVLSSIGSATGSQGAIELSGTRVTGRASLAANARSSQSSLSTSTSASTPISGTLGWGSSLSAKLARMKQGENLDGRKSVQGMPTHSYEGNVATSASIPSASAMTAHNLNRDGSKSPVRKKTRFITSKGIREAGRESLGNELASFSGALVDDGNEDDEEDELVVE